ncbi:sedoheptulose 7-phosphate cyclase [Archangium violaceum]|uniref:sedoheptulose 7-phosphate cyclase n=1 Tax=Archangium violaceum TaxID=83451 RepID=UPI00193B6AC6|nr:sedoheptulose 7-phosphate cyclase [Archangium violaceum]QRK10071.1 sedoheptulose 7-phosphate cyclase [Archangium violaceum]
MMSTPSGALESTQAAEHVWHVNAIRPVKYRVLECSGLFQTGNDTLVTHLFASKGRRRRALLVVDETVARLHGASIQRYFERHEVETSLFPLATTESEKNIENVLRISKAMHAFGLNRRSDPLIGIGGGVLLDIVGLAANLYRRGTPYIRVPTTLMGLIDAGIGVKTGVNFDEHKNRLGSYYAPDAAFLDRTFLNTLDARHVSNGLAEVLKMALIKDARLFELMERHASRLVPDRLLGSPDYDEIFRRAVHGMLEELEPNLWEDTLERCVDYGHSFSPLLEMKALPGLLHGEAVGIDMVFSLILARNRGLTEARDVERVVAVMRHLALPLSNPLVTPEFMREGLEDATRHRDGKQRLPLTRGLGGCTFVNDVTPAELARAVEDHHRLAARFEAAAA